MKRIQSGSLRSSRTRGASSGVKWRSARRSVSKTVIVEAYRRRDATERSDPQVHRAHDRGGPRLDSELLVDSLKMLVHGSGADRQDLADVAVGLAAGEPAQHFLLPRRELRWRRPLHGPNVLHRAAQPVEIREMRADRLEATALDVGEIAA